MSQKQFRHPAVPVNVYVAESRQDESSRRLDHLCPLGNLHSSTLTNPRDSVSLDKDDSIPDGSSPRPVNEGAALNDQATVFNQRALAKEHHGNNQQGSTDSDPSRYCVLHSPILLVGDCSGFE